MRGPDPRGTGAIRRLARRAGLALALGAAALPSPASAQRGTGDLALFRALDFERQGRYEESAAAFRQVLTTDPLSVQALAGAERVYTQIGRRDSIAAMVARALAADPQHTVARQIDVRTARAQGGETMAAEAIMRWMTAAPRSDAPFRELVRTLLASGRVDDAREAVQAARARLGAEVLRTEMAQVEATAGNWQRAASEWRAQLMADPDLLTVAGFNLRAAPAERRESVVRVLTADTALVPRWLAAELLVSWNEADRAWILLQAALPPGREARRAALQRFADRARQLEGPGPKRAAAAALERLALESAGADATRLRVESARSWAEAGDAAAARRVLRAMADDPSASRDASVQATTTLIELYARDGQAADAARLLAQARGRVPGSEADRLGLMVARAWLTQGRFEQAEAQLAMDSSMAADEVRGWVALYRGDLASARTLLRGGAAARSGDPRPAVERAQILELLSVVRGDTVPALGAALALVARGDTVGAANALAGLARDGTVGGTPELLALAARYLERRDPARSEALWHEVAERHARSAPAAAAQLALARVMAARGDAAGAARRLEAMILGYPESALVPEARRELDRVRGMIPRS